MGMFDWVRVEVQLPDNYPDEERREREFQTKEFDNIMQTYVITNKGELYRECYEYEWIEDETRQLFGGYMKEIEGSYRREYLDFHGDLRFYSGSKYNGKWRDYYARFTEGKLTKIWYEDTEL